VHHTVVTTCIIPPVDSDQESTVELRDLAAALRQRGAAAWPNSPPIA
jgi:hypothetical protein